MKNEEIQSKIINKRGQTTIANIPKNAYFINNSPKINNPIETIRKSFASISTNNQPIQNASNSAKH